MKKNKISKNTARKDVLQEQDIEKIEIEGNLLSNKCEI